MVKIVSEEVESYRVKIVVERKTRIVINPNGRGYEADNVDKYNIGDVLDVTVQAVSADDARAKVSALMLLIEDA